MASGKTAEEDISESAVARTLPCETLIGYLQRHGIAHGGLQAIF